MGAPLGPRQPEQRSRALLDAAAELFVEKGVGATSIDEIAARAGVAKGTFYHYFPDRATMLGALRQRFSLRFADAAEAAIGACDPQDWWAKLDAWVTVTAQEYVASYSLHDVIFHEPAVCHRWVMGDEPIVRLLQTLLSDGSDVGAWSVEDASLTAVGMFHAVHGVVDEALATGSDTGRIAPYLSRLFRNMVRPV